MTKHYTESSKFRKLEQVDKHLPIEDYALIGDGMTAALVGRDGSIDWLCLPQFDGEAIFAGLLDHEKGGSFWIRPTGPFESRQYYCEDCAVLNTEIKTANGQLKITDVLSLRRGCDLIEGLSASRSELVRLIEVQSGDITVEIGFFPRNVRGSERRDDGFVLECGADNKFNINCHSDAPFKLGYTSFNLKQGQQRAFVLRWCEHSYYYRPFTAHELIDQTRTAWKQWADHIQYQGPRSDLVRRSAITLKLLDYTQNGAIIAAPTTSLPETIGGVRNWDYRYVWIRDTSFTVYALRRIGLTAEASAFLAWVFDDVESEAGIPSLVYTVNGKKVPGEFVDKTLLGYRGSKPVRFGNEAAEQIQHDVYGELIDAAYQWSDDHEIKDHLWQKIQPFISKSIEKWDTKGHGIWEKQASPRRFTYSSAICHVALDRAIRIAERFSLSGDTRYWRSEADKIQQAILNQCWSEKRQSITEYAGGDSLDASILTLPLRRVIAADHPKMVATTNTIAEQLSAGDGLIYRYNNEETPDGLKGKEGAFVLCSFWLAENYAMQGRYQEASDLFEKLCDRCNHVGLLSEEIDPSSGRFLGNFPQAFSHVGLISTAARLANIYKQK